MLLPEQREPLTTVGHIARPPAWRKSSRSLGGTDCVETARLDSTGHVIGIRDSKDPSGPFIAVTPAQWRLLTERIRRGRYDVP
ncbi:DUF397 domain-containing protein [Actinomadura luteofluorescens]|uniref:DUF397 domain-containing protein n=1 Tax=Actinomadura luteofluorescens TaxID=46163 RepID=UPI0037AEC037